MDSSFSQILDQLRQQDEGAAQRVYDRFAQRLVALAGRNLEPRLRKKVDPEDVAQSVFKSVLIRLGRGEFELGNWDSLWGLMVRFTLHRCSEWVKYFHAAKRNVNREAVLPDQGGSDVSWEFLDREPLPEEGLALAETLDRLLAGLSEQEQDIVTRSLQGESVNEVSAALGCTESKVYRTRKRAQQRLERWITEAT